MPPRKTTCAALIAGCAFMCNGIVNSQAGATFAGAESGTSTHRIVEGTVSESCTPALLRNGEPAVVVVLVAGIRTELHAFSWQPLKRTECPDSPSGSALEETGLVANFSNPIPTPNTDLVEFLAENGAVVLPYSYANGLSLTSTKTGVLVSVKAYSKDDAGGKVLPDEAGVAVPGTAAYRLNAELNAIHRAWKRTRIIVVGHSDGGLVAERWWQDSVRGAPKAPAPTTTSGGVSRVLALDSPINGMPGNPCSGGNPVQGFCDYFHIHANLVNYWNALWAQKQDNDRRVIAAATKAATNLTIIGTQNDVVYKSAMLANTKPRTGDWTLVPQMVFTPWRTDGSPQPCAEDSRGATSLTCANIDSPNVENTTCNDGTVGFISGTLAESHGQVITCPATQQLIESWLLKYESRRPGSEIWGFTARDGIEGPPAVVDGVVYTESDDGNVYALNASTGSLVWSHLIDSQADSSPAVVNGVVYVGGFDGVFALNAATGAEIWSFNCYRVDSRPAVVNGVVYVGSYDGNVYALSAATGSKVWSAGAGIVESSPTVRNGVVYVGVVYVGAGGVLAMNAATGAILWSSAEGSGVAGSPEVVNGIVYAGSGDDSVYALNASTGAKIWSFATGSSVVSTPAIIGGVVYVGSTDHSVYALNSTTGTKIWSFRTGAAVESTPAVLNGRVYLGSSDDSIYAVSTKAGAELWSFKTGSAVDSSPSVVDGIVYVGSADHSLYALQA